MKVCEKVQKKGVTTYNEVADELVAEFSSSDNHMSPNDAVSPADRRSCRRPWAEQFLTSLQWLCVLKHVYDQKNIRRRVYDALNVLMAMNIISKEKKEIKWIGLPTNSAQECQNLEVGASPSAGNTPPPKHSPLALLAGGEATTAGEDQAETITAPGAHPAGTDGCTHTYVCVCTGHFDQFTSAVVTVVLQQIAFKNLVQRNKQTELQANRPPPPNSIIHLPFIIVNTSKKTVIDCSISSDKYAARLAVI